MKLAQVLVVLHFSIVDIKLEKEGRLFYERTEGERNTDTNESIF